MSVVEPILARVSVLETEMKNLAEKIANRDKMSDEFMDRTDARLKILVTQSDEWSGVRKTLTVLVSALALFGTFAGWLLHELFPHGWRP